MVWIVLPKTHPYELLGIYPRDGLMTINIPNLVTVSVQGNCGEYQGSIKAEYNITKLTDPRGQRCYWSGLSKFNLQRKICDGNAIGNGYIVVIILYTELSCGGVVSRLGRVSW